MVAQLSSFDSNVYQQHLTDIYQEIDQELEELYQESLFDYEFEEEEEIEHHQEENIPQHLPHESHWMTPRGRVHKTSLDKNTTTSINTHQIKLKNHLLRLTEEIKFIKKELPTKIIKKETNENSSTLLFLKTNKNTIDDYTKKIQQLLGSSLDDSLAALKKSSNDLLKTVKYLEDSDSASQKESVKVTKLMQKQTNEPRPNEVILKSSWKDQKEYFQREIKIFQIKVLEQKSNFKTKDKLRYQTLLRTTEATLLRMSRDVENMSIGIELSEQGNQNIVETKEKLQRRLQEFHECLGMFKEQIELATQSVLRDQDPTLLSSMVQNQKMYEDKEHTFTIDGVENEPDSHSGDQGNR